VWDNGKKWVILDDLVVDVEKFALRHPGGQFAINQNIGRNISKYFYGGYSLEGNIGSQKSGHLHTNYAKKIVIDIAIGRLATCDDDKDEGSDDDEFLHNRVMTQVCR